MGTRPLIFICGDQHGGTQTIKSTVLVNLAAYWSVRTHPLPNKMDNRADPKDLYQAIRSSNVFVFLFSKDSIYDSYYLNQLGIAIAYGIPIVGVRSPSTTIPNPLPDYYYYTEIMTYTGNRSNIESIGVTRVGSARSSNLTLAEVLVREHKNAIVYAMDFHKTCIERLIQKVSSGVETFKERKVDLRLEDVKFSGNGAKCPECGHKNGVVPSHNWQRGYRLGGYPLQRAASHDSLNITKPRTQDAFVKGTFSEYHMDIHSSSSESPSIKKSLTPAKIVIPSSSVSLTSSREGGDSTRGEPLISKVQKENSTFIPPVTSTKIGSNSLMSTTGKSSLLYGSNNGSITTGKNSLGSVIGNATSMTGMSSLVPATRKSSLVTATGNASIRTGHPTRGLLKTRKSRSEDSPSRKSSTESRKTSTCSDEGRKPDLLEHLYRKLRRQSSLPVIPTTYMVTTPEGTNSTISLVNYPPEKKTDYEEKRESSDDDLFLEELIDDDSSIHLSRPPSPDVSSSI